MTGEELGVDFGTTSTVAVVRPDSGVPVPLLIDGSPSIPSAVFLDLDGTLLTGQDALRSARGAPASLEPHPKRCIDDGTLLLGGQQVPVTEVIAAVLGRVADEARRVLGGAAPRTRLTHPVAWGPRRTGLLLAAAERAGLGEVQLVPEPVAAAAYAASDGVWLCYDLGAGTTDLTLVRGGTVLASGGLPDVGGLDIDQALVDHFGAALSGREGWARLVAPRTASDRRAAMAFRGDVRQAKEVLSRRSSTVVHVPLVDVDVPLGRETLDEVALPVLRRTLGAVRKLVRGGPPLDGVFLVGGGCRMPLVATLLHRELGLPPVLVESPETIVALGSLLVDRETPPPLAPDQPAAAATQAAPAAEPAAAKPGSPEPAAAGPAAGTAATQPAATQPPATEPAAARRGGAEPAAVEAAVIGSAAAQPAAAFGGRTATRARRGRWIGAVGSAVIVIVLVLVFSLKAGDDDKNPDTPPASKPRVTGDATATRIGDLKAPGEVTTIHLSDGAALIVAADGTGRTWCAKLEDSTWRPLPTGPPLVAVVFDDRTQDGTAAGLRTDGTLDRWSTETATRTARDASIGPVARAVTADRDLLAVGPDRRAQLWNPFSTDRGRARFTLPTGTDAITAGGDLVAAHTTDGTVHLLDARTTGTFEQRLTLDTGPVTALTANGNDFEVLLAAADPTGRVRLWDYLIPSDASPQRRYPGFRAVDDNPVVTPGNPKRATREHRTVAHGRPLSALVFSDDGQYLATADPTGTINIWDVANGMRLAAVTHLKGLIAPLDFRGRRLYVPTADTTGVRIWKIELNQA
ncbi:Hsp70 family protein [Cryptosporangium sp. NPDC048952]|uniref:Hsp70 family protein n=1 Tax=Cryptosporangium sp. NPDC048952 TaxID=3363961 RepID=UPI00371FEC89